MREMLSSKKFQAATAAIVVWLVGYVGLDADLETVGPIVATIIAYILSQGVADQGKSAELERTRRAALESVGRLQQIGWEESKK